jgi:hypothetical protein
MRVDVESVLAHYPTLVAAQNVCLQVSFLHRTFANLLQQHHQRGLAPISIVVLGNAGVGKSAFTYRFVTGKFPEEVRCFHIFLGILSY